MILLIFIGLILKMGRSVCARLPEPTLIRGSQAKRRTYLVNDPCRRISRDEAPISTLKVPGSTYQLLVVSFQ